MKPINPKHLNLLIFLVAVNLWSIELVAQPRVIANIPIGTHSPIISDSNQLITIYGDSKNQKKFLTETNITTGFQISYEIPQEADVFDCYFNSKGFFFFRGRNNSNTSLVDTLLFYDYLTKKVISLGEINFRNGPNDFENNYRILGVFNEQFYFLGTNKTKNYSIWRSNGTSSGTKMIATLTTPFVQCKYVNGFFIFSSTNLIQSNITSISDTSLTLTTLSTFDAKRYQINFADYSFNDGFVYINVFDTLSKDYECFSTQGTIQTTQSKFRHPTITYITNGFSSRKLIAGSSFVDTLFVRSIETGAIVKRVPLPSELKRSNGGSVYPIANGVFTAVSDKFGVELGYLNKQDSFILIDINDGPFSVLNQFDLSFRRNDLVVFNQEAKVDSFYLFGLQPRSNRNCLYQVVIGEDSATVFRLTNLDYLNNPRVEVDKPFLHRSKLYQMAFDINAGVKTLYQINPDAESGIVTRRLIDSSLTWHRQIGFGAAVRRDPQYMLSDIAIDSDDNSILSVNVLERYNISNFSNNRDYLFKPFQQYDTRFSQSINSQNFTFKLSPYGNIIWLTSFGNNDWRVSNPIHQVIDKNNDVYVVASAYKTAIFKSDTIRRQNAFLYLVKLNGEDGNILYYKVLAESFYINSLKADVIKIDDNNNLYIAFQYENFELSFANSIVQNDKVSPANALAKFDSEGNLLWVKNTLTPFTIYFGATRDLYIDDTNKKIYLLQSVGSFNWSSSCKFNNWDSYLQCLTFDGDVSWSKQIVSDDLHSLRSINIDNEGNINLTGYFRGNIKFDQFNLTSKPANGCNQFQYVTATLHPYDGKTLMANTSTDWVYLPHKNVSSAVNSQFISIGFEPVNSRQYTLMAKETDKWGGIIGFHKIEKKGSPFDFDFFPSIASKGSYIVVADISYNTFDTFSNIMSWVYNVSIARYTKEGFFKTADYIFPINDEFVINKKYNLLIYPNPCSDNLKIYNEELDGILSAKVFSFDGKELLTLNGNIDNNIGIYDISNLESGFYFLMVTGAKGIETYKFIKD